MASRNLRQSAQNENKIRDDPDMKKKLAQRISRLKELLAL
jgi:hypothetical protein